MNVPISSCQPNSYAVTRCHTPLIDMCDSDTQIKLDLGSCDLCASDNLSLLIQKGGCPEYETICVEPEPHPMTCGCNCCPTLPPRFPQRTIEVPKPAVVYPLHDIDIYGFSIFALDGKLKAMGYGRYNATVLINNIPTHIKFDIDYIPSRMGLHAIDTSKVQPNLEEC